MNCPFCCEPVAEAATVCKTCRRDITVPRPLMEAHQKLEERVQALEAELAELRVAAPQPGPFEPTPERSPLGWSDFVLRFICLPVLSILLAHYLLVIKIDARLVWLRAASIVLPALFGYWLEVSRGPRWYVVVGGGMASALVSVFGMSAVVSAVDGAPLLPTSAVVWRETMEYAASIALAYMLGGLIANGLHPALSKQLRVRNPLVRLAELLAVPDKAAGKGKARVTLEHRVERLVKLMNLCISAATAAGAIYTGFKGIL